jgi:UDP-3-O-[3-hydroxymyristoyl] glucosamine N-acyltransferase
MNDKQEFTIGDILKLGDSNTQVVNNNPDYKFTTVGTTLPGTEQTMVFISSDRKDKEQLVRDTKAKIIICDFEVENEWVAANQKCLIKVKDPKLFFSIVANELFVKRKKGFIHPSSVIDPEAVIDPSAYIGPNCTIGKVIIGSNTVIYGNVFLYDRTVIGKNVTINAGTVIGAEGFGYNRNEKGQAIQFPHLGGVIIEDDVEIGTNTSIDRGALSDTILKRGCKIDNLVHIAHNVQIGEDAYVIANAMIGGSTKIGDRSYIAPSVSLKDQLVIGDDSLIGMAASLLKNVGSNEIWSGNPAREFGELKKLQKALQVLIQNLEDK